MAQQPPLRRRDRHARLDDDYASDNVYGRNPPYWEASEDHQPRRHKSERRPRHSPADSGGSSRRARDEEPRRSDRHGGRERRPRSPPPRERERDRDREPRESRRGGDSRREPRSSRYERDYPSRDPTSARHNARGYTSDDEPRRGHRRTQTEGMPHRPRYASPDAKPRGGGGGGGRGRDNISPPPDDRYARRRGDGGGGRGGSPVGATRPRARDYMTNGDDDRDRDHKSRPRPRSHDRSPARGRPPPAGSGSRAAAAAGGTSANRRQSMPASTKAKWWQNPMVQNGARTAFSAGAQAAMQHRHAGGDWMGAKGAKVASAAIGAAIMDGFANRNKDKEEDGGGRGGRDRSRDRSRDRDRERDRGRDRDRSRDRAKRGSGGREKSGGGGGSTRDKLLKEGFNFVAKKAMDRGGR